MPGGHPESKGFDAASVPLAPSSSAPGPVPVAAVLPLLDELGSLSPDATGRFVFESDADECAILVKNGRVCWAASSRQRGRLTDILRMQHDPPLPRGEFEKIFVSCRRSGRPLGESLIAAGLTSSDHLREALLRHATETIALLGDRGASVRSAAWVPHSEPRYNAAFTFSPSDLLTSYGASRDAPAAAVAKQVFDALLDDAGTGVAFIFDALGSPLPVCSVRIHPMSATEVIALAGWVAESLDLAQCGGADPIVTCFYERGTRSVAWSSNGVHFIVFLDSDAGLLRALAHVRKRRAEARDVCARGPHARGRRMIFGGDD